jgi:hypothetical protein
MTKLDSKKQLFSFSNSGAKVSYLATKENKDEAAAKNSWFLSDQLWVLLKILRSSITRFARDVQVVASAAKYPQILGSHPSTVHHV